MPDPSLTEAMVILANLRDDMAEVRDRARRTETRLTRFIQSQGIDPGVTRPRYDPHTSTVHMPSPDCAVKDVIAAIPPLLRTKVLTVNLMVGTDLIGTMTVPAV